MSGISFIGLGKMGTALAHGIIGKCYEPEEVRAYDISEAARGNFADAFPRVRVFDTLSEAVEGVHVVVLCVKPQNFSEMGSQIKPHLGNALVISILGGTPLVKLAETLGTARVIRVMPNLPVTVGEGISCYTSYPDISTQDIDTVERLLAASGKTMRVEESWMDAVTGVSGSGPAFVLEFLIGLTEGGIAQGLPRQTAQALAAQTILGTIRLLNETALPPETLRDNVISPNGTTAAGMNILNTQGFTKTVADAVSAAAQRSIELGKE